MRAHLDFETASVAELVGARSVGAHRYAEDETTRVWLFSWSLGDGLIYRWHPGDTDPMLLLEHIQLGKPVVSHNAMFERVIWAAMRDKYKLAHWPMLKAEQQICTMAKGMAMNLPGSLEQLATVMDMAEQKDIEGFALMRRMSKPSKDGSWPLATPGNIKRLGEYCDQDVKTEMAVDHAVPDLSSYEQKLWALDQIINDRGVPLDIASVVRAIDVVGYAKSQANQRMKELTEGSATKCTEVGKIVGWINKQGIQCTSFRKGDHDDLIVLAGFMGNTKVEQVVELRRDSSKTSTAKFLKMLECVCSDGRAKGQFQFHGATQTGRWAGRLIQLQNIRRVDWEDDEYTIQYTIWCLNAPLSIIDTYEMILIGTGRPLDALSLCLRAMIKAEPGHTLLGADFSNIEGRVNAWLAGETWKLDAFRAYDDGTGPDLYKLAYSRSFGEPIESIGKGSKRQIGKVQELACGYQGGVGAFITMGQTYNLKPFDLVEPVRAATPPEFWEKIFNSFDSATDKHGLLQEQWTAIKVIVTNWRGAHPMIKSSWYELQDAAIKAVSYPGTIIPVYSGRVRYLSDGNYLFCQLPSARVICYPQPHVRYTKTEYVEIDGNWVETDTFWEPEIEAMRTEGYKFITRGKNTVWFYGVDPETKQWMEGYLYGGHQCENIVQAVSRCILDRAMMAIERAGYPIILHAHDEILAHVKKDFGSLEHFKSLMLVNDPWLAGLPLAVSGFQDERYTK